MEVEGNMITREQMRGDGYYNGHGCGDEFGWEYGYGDGYADEYGFLGGYGCGYGYSCGDGMGCGVNSKEFYYGSGRENCAGGECDYY